MVVPPKGYQLIVNPGYDVWDEVLAMLRDNNLNWFVHEEDYDTYIEGIGGKDYNLTVILEVAKNIVTAFVATYRLGTEKPYYGFSFFFVRPTHRNLGLGKVIWDHALEDSIFANQNFCMLLPDYLVDKLTYFQQTAHFKVQVTRALVGDLQIANLPLPNPGTIKVTSFRYSEHVQKLDMLVTCGTNRNQYLQEWLKAKNCVSSYIAIDVKAEEPEVVGFVGLHVSRDNDLAVTPLYAKSQEIAGALLRKALNTIDLKKYENIYFYVPSSNPVARKFYIKLTAGSLVQDMALTLKFVNEPTPFKTDLIYSICDATMSII